MNISEWDEVVLLNSSVLGPVFPIKGLFEDMSNVDCDYWGMTDSFDVKHHIHSYFFVFRKKVLTSPSFAAFWNSVIPYRNKHQVILSYEVGLTQWFEDEGFVPHIVVDVKRVFEYYKAKHPVLYLMRRLFLRRKKKKNTTEYFPEELLDLGVPFLKLKVLIKNKEFVRIENIYRTLESHDCQVERL